MKRVCGRVLIDRLPRKQAQRQSRVRTHHGTTMMQDGEGIVTGGPADFKPPV